MCMHDKMLQLCLTLLALWTIACQAPLSMEFSRQEHWSKLPLPSPKDLPDSGIEILSLTSPAWAGGLFTTRATWEAPYFPQLGLNHVNTIYTHENIFNVHDRKSNHWAII